MRVKKFEAKNMKEALQMVKNHLGPDAVILSAKDNRRNFGIAGEASVEITAAVSESTLQKKNFTESKMTADVRQRFQNSDARTQRAIIDRMVENRHRDNEKEAQVAARRPMTKMSYIDIPDDDHAPPVETHRRRPNPANTMERAAGRNVRELLQDFDDDVEHEDQWVEAPKNRKPAQPARVAAQAAQLKPATQMAHMKPATQAGQSRGNAQVTSNQMTSNQASPEAAPVSEKALSRIRNAAREAWQAGIFTNDEPKAPVNKSTSQQNVQSSGQSGGLEMVAQNHAPHPDIDSLKSEIGRLHQMLETFQKVPQTFVSRHPGAEFQIPFELSFMFQKLTDSGMTVDNTVEILQKASREMDPMQMKKPPIVEAWVARWFLDNTKIVSNPFQGRVHLFVGGAGSGKTSALVKMASHLVVKEKKKVAVLSTDSFKVGAVDQLKIYCQILNVPFAVIRNRHDWEWVLSQLGSVDHILVDFPGLQLRDINEIDLLKSLLPPTEAAAVTHLCVAATTKDGDAYEFSRRYKVANYQDLIVTNLDQSVQHGIITNLQLKTGKPLHSFGIGSRLPEDFELASKERVLDLIFKLTKFRGTK